MNQGVLIDEAELMAKHGVTDERCVRWGDARLVIDPSELGAQVDVMTFKRPDSLLSHSFAGGLGWGVPAALGAKLAAPDRLVIAAVGDGSYMFANPIACHQVAEALDIPLLIIVFNNEVWNAVRKSTRAVYPEGHASRANRMPLSSLSPAPAYEKIIEASHGHGERIDDPDALPAALERAIDLVMTEHRQVLLNVVCAIDDRGWPLGGIIVKAGCTKR